MHAFCVSNPRALRWLQRLRPPKLNWYQVIYVTSCLSCLPGQVSLPSNAKIKKATHLRPMCKVCMYGM